MHHFGNYVRLLGKFCYYHEDSCWINCQLATSCTSGGFIFQIQRLLVTSVILNRKHQIIYFCHAKELCRSGMRFSIGGVHTAIPETVSQLYSQFGFLSFERRNRRWKFSLWHVTCWCLWSQRNKIAFRNEAFDAGGILHFIKSISWQWFSYRKKVNTIFFFSSWNANPLLSLTDSMLLFQLGLFTGFILLDVFKLICTPCTGYLIYIYKFTF